MGKRDLTEIITGTMIAQEKGQATFRQHLRAIYNSLNRQGTLVIDFVEEIDQGNFVQARVEHGRWGAHCECGGAEYVCPSDPVFYCFSCGNADANGKLRPVQFPSAKDIEDIGLLLCERPVSVHKGITKSSINLNSRPLGKLSRDFDPDNDNIAILKSDNQKEGLESDTEKIKEKKVK